MMKKVQKSQIEQNSEKIISQDIDISMTQSQFRKRDKVKDIQRKAQNKQTAQKILDEINKLNERSDEVIKRRWIWELLQNAKDVAYNKEVKIQIVLEEDTISFKHSGKPFTLQNLVHLISQVSSKDRAQEGEEVPETTGKYGTGFITTHLLSEIVTVSGIIQDDERNNEFQSFSLVLDRSSKDLDTTFQKVEKSLSVLDKLDDEDTYPIMIDYQVGQNCDTSFTYHLEDNDSKETAQIGIKDLKNSIFQTMAFVPAIKSVEVINKIQNQTILYEKSKQEQIDKDLQLFEFIQKQNEQTTNFTYILGKSKNIQALRQIDADKKIIIEQINNQPKQFVDFPLIGSEQFDFPLIVNSHLFFPDEPRSKIIMSVNQKHPNSLSNKKLFEEILVIYENITRYLSKNNYTNLILMAQTELPTSQYLDQKWFESNIQKPLREIILTIPMIKVENQQELKLINECVYLENRYSLNEDFQTSLYQIYKEFYPNQILPINDQEYLKKCYEILSKWEEQKYLIKNINDILSLIQDKKNLTNLCKHLLVSNNILQGIEKINQTINFMMKYYKHSDIISLLSDYSILPNQKQSNPFKKINELKLDNNLDPNLKDIYQFYEQGFLGELLHSSISINLNDKLISIQYQNKDLLSQIGLIVTKYVSQCISSNQFTYQPFLKLYLLTQDTKSAIDEKEKFLEWLQILFEDQIPDYDLIISDLIIKDDIQLLLNIYLINWTNQELLCQNQEWCKKNTFVVNQYHNLIYQSSSKIPPNQFNIESTKLYLNQNYQFCQGQEVKIDENVQQCSKDLCQIIDEEVESSLLALELNNKDNKLVQQQIKQKYTQNNIDNKICKNFIKKIDQRVSQNQITIEIQQLLPHLVKIPTSQLDSAKEFNEFSKVFFEDIQEIQKINYDKPFKYLQYIYEFITVDIIQNLTQEKFNEIRKNLGDEKVLQWLSQIQDFNISFFKEYDQKKQDTRKTFMIEQLLNPNPFFILYNFSQLSQDHLNPELKKIGEECGFDQNNYLFHKDLKFNKEIQEIVQKFENDKIMQFLIKMETNEQKDKLQNLLKFISYNGNESLQYLEILISYFTTYIFPEPTEYNFKNVDDYDTLEQQIIKIVLKIGLDNFNQKNFDNLLEKEGEQQTIEYCNIFYNNCFIYDIINNEYYNYTNYYKHPIQKIPNLHYLIPNQNQKLVSIQTLHKDKIYFQIQYSDEIDQQQKDEEKIVIDKSIQSLKQMYQQYIDNNLFEKLAHKDIKFNYLHFYLDSITFDTVCENITNKLKQRQSDYLLDETDVYIITSLKDILQESKNIHKVQEQFKWFKKQQHNLFIDCLISSETEKNCLIEISKNKKLKLLSEIYNFSKLSKEHILLINAAQIKEEQEEIQKQKELDLKIKQEEEQKQQKDEEEQQQEQQNQSQLQVIQNQVEQIKIEDQNESNSIEQQKDQNQNQEELEKDQNIANNLENENTESQLNKQNMRNLKIE